MEASAPDAGEEVNPLISAPAASLHTIVGMITAQWLPSGSWFRECGTLYFSQRDLQGEERILAHGYGTSTIAGEMLLPRERRTSITDPGHRPMLTAMAIWCRWLNWVVFKQVRGTAHLHKDMERLVYAMAETAAAHRWKVVLDVQRRLAREPLAVGFTAEWAGEGEWKITIEVFRDLGIALGVVLLGIYILLSILAGSVFSAPANSRGHAPDSESCRLLVSTTRYSSPPPARLDDRSGRHRSFATRDVH
jgi:hypothetical protein